ncbi:hypothetical protein FSP39_003635, partial [Pinctada imbricata]
FLTFQVDNVKLIERYVTRKPSVGTLYLTTTHLIFVDSAGKRETWILHMHISGIERQPLNASGSPLQIRCKDFRCITFVLPRDRDCQDIYTSLQELSKPSNIESLYAFQYSQQDSDDKSYGWNMYDTQTEYLRMGVPNELWTLTNLNQNYELCDTYPSHIFVPTSANTPVLVGSSKFRSRGRLPALSYLHRNNQAAICRCSQPLAGFSARCVEDEQMLHSILKSNPKSKFMYVVDTRPKILLCHVYLIREYSICEMRNPNMSAFLQGLENSGWLKHIKAVLDTSVFIAERRSGYQFGHKFTDRLGILETVDAKEASPVYTQFLDATWQVMQQYPCAFQFNERFLLTLHDHAYSCQFGTFIGNCEKDRVDLRLAERTYSLWGYITKNMADYINPLYKKEYEVKTPVLIPNTGSQCIKFWKGMYNRYETGLHPREHISDTLSAAKDHSTSLEDHVRLLEKRVTQICKALGKSEDSIQKALDGFPSMESLNGILNDLPQTDTQSLLRMKSDEIHENEQMASKDVLNDVKSDTESGFDENGSQMSKSGLNEINSQMSKSGMEDGSVNMETSMMSSSMSNDNLSLDILLMEIRSVALDWRSFRNIPNCICASPFDSFIKKASIFIYYCYIHIFCYLQHHCWKCGQVFCTRCIAKSIPLPGHYSHRPVPVCRSCYKEIRHSPSMEFPPITNSVTS